MVLRFIFETLSTQGIIEKICIRVARNVGVDIGLSRDENNLYVYVKGDEESIDNFSRELAKELPMTLFLKSLNAEVVEEFRDDLKRDFPDIVLPPCPKCLREYEKTKDVNIKCEVCGYDKTLNGEIEYKDGAEVETFNGLYKIVPLKEADFVIARDISVIGKYFMVFEAEIKALGSIQKPLMLLNTNLEFKKSFNLSIPAFYVKLPDCLITHKLFEISQNELIGLKIQKEYHTAPKVVVTQSADVLVYSGERALVPTFRKFIEGEGRYKNYVAKGVKDKSVIFKTHEFKDDVIASYGGLMGIVEDYNITESVCGFCMYEVESKVLLYSQKHGIVEYLNFEFEFGGFNEIVDKIKEDEIGAKLIENYLQKFSFPEISLNSKIKGIYYLFGVVGALLGFGSVEDGAKELLNRADSAFSKKGVRIDYKLKDKNIDPLWVIRNVMSYRLAGVDEGMICYGVVESFAEFLSGVYDGIEGVGGALLVGDIFTKEFVRKTYEYISKNHKVYVPKALPLSGAIESYGALAIKSKVK
ncbi:MAG: hypothetical protein GXO62_05075 [Epsilonproteobacteria bacterium]|nr:hypothetical protein [Campylobacterota bacterium]